VTNEPEQVGRPVGGDSLIVARTFDARAKALRQGEPAATMAEQAILTRAGGVAARSNKLGLCVLRPRSPR